MLTAKQKFLMDTYGYVIIPNLVEPDLMERIRKDMDSMDRELSAVPRGNPWPGGKPRKYTGTPYFSKFGPCIEYAPSFLEIATHPKILACAEDIVGGPVRYEEQECSINSRDPNETAVDIRRLGWHRGISPDYSRYEGNGRNHFLWVKAIVFLTDIGLEDGGTSVIPGTHRTGSTVDIVPELEPWMAHQAQGSAGDVLFFSEALIHAVTPILSDRKRYIIITGYIPPFMREYSSADSSSPEFLASLEGKERIFMTGDDPQRSRYGFRMK